MFYCSVKGVFGLTVSRDGINCWIVRYCNQFSFDQMSVRNTAIVVSQIRFLT